jgi:hypothetical protein
MIMMNMIQEVLGNIPIPRMVRIKQTFDNSVLEDPTATTKQQLLKEGTLDMIKPGQQVAIAVGSRGIANIALVTRVIVDAVKSVGALPFIVPCMGSHGGATAEGQADVLHHLGIDEQSMGVPIRSSMEVVKLDELDNGLPIYCDLIASKADAIIVINRVKPHTAFRGKIESGMLKMIAIGLGKQKGAEACHQLGFKYMAENVPAMARIMIERLPIVFGIAMVENAYDQTSLIEAIPAKQLEDREPALLELAKSNMPKLFFEQLDVLVIDYIGKNISGDGMDPNITGRYPTPYAHGGPDVTKMVVLAVTPESNGNVNGVGTADFTTRRLTDMADWTATYLNGLTSTVCAPTKTATTLETDLLAIKAAVKTCNILDYTQCRMVRIQDTLHLGEIEISANLVEEARKHSEITILSESYELDFDENGHLI